MMQASSVTSLSPSFNSYSNTRLAEIAARVVGEFDSEEFYDEFYFEREDAPAAEGEQNSEYLERERGDSDEDDDKQEEFEFAFVNKETNFPSLISADEIFHNGQIRPVYPVFNREFFFESSRFQQENRKGEKGVKVSDPTIRLPLRKLFIEERETTMTMTMTSSSSSSEADELDGVPEESYCVWQPKEAAAEGRCKKSGSAGSNSRKWKFKDLLHRSHSDGSKDSFVFLSHSNSGRKKQNEAPARGGNVNSAAAAAPPPPVFNAAEKRRSYLPYRQDLVGFFANVNGLSKNLQPF